MKIKSKITIILICCSILFIILSSYIFKGLLVNYLERQEIAQISSLNKSLTSYLRERTNNYQGRVNDWSHWDDTYNYLDDNNPNYVEQNLMEDTFINLEISFIILLREDNSIIRKDFYDLENNQRGLFPNDFDYKKIIEFSENADDNSNILRVGEQFYFIATSEVTDSLSEKQSNGKMIFGRYIDEDIVNKLGNLTDSKITISAENFDATQEVNTIVEGSSDLLHLIKLEKNKNLMTMDFIIADSPDEDNTILLSSLKSRDLFIEGSKQVGNFILIYIFIMICFILLVFLLLGKFLSKPFTKLIDEVRDINLTTKKIQELKIYGKDEFAFLKQSINIFLNRIEIEQSKVREGKEKLELTFNSVGDAVITVDSNGNIDFMNPIAQRLTGWKLDDAYGNSFETVFDIINEHTREKMESPIKKVFKNKEIIELDNHTILISKDGTERAIEDTAAPIINEFEEVIGIVLVFRDISEKLEKRQQIEYLSYHDQLTGLYNRRFFEIELKRLDTNRNLPLSIVYADVNGLKTFNDAFGHDYGDLLIQKVANVFKNECRSDDIISRTGGDEFVMLLPNTSGDSAANLVKRIQDKVGQEVIMNITLSVSFGCDTKEQENQLIWEVMKNSEELMYQAKILINFSERNAVIRSILKTLHLRSPREEAHSNRVSSICADIGKAFNLNEDHIKELSLAGELHDIGKISIEKNYYIRQVSLHRPKGNKLNATLKLVIDY